MSPQRPPGPPPVPSGESGERDAALRLPQALRRLRLRDLETLSLLGRTRSFSQTAEHCALTQSAISRWLQDLESALSAVLFERTTRHVAPTAFGAALLDAVDQALAQLRAVEPAFAALRQGFGHSVSVGILPGMALVLIPDTLAYLERHGRPLQIRLHENTLDRLLPQVQRHELDLVICRLDAAAMNSGLAIAPLYDEQVRVFCSAAHPLCGQDTVSWQDAARHPWIMAPPGTPMRQAVEAEFARHGVALPPVLLESVSVVTNAAIAQRSTCLFASFYNSVTRLPTGSALHALPLAVTSVSPTIVALHAEPCARAVAAVLEALRAVGGQLPPASFRGP